MKIQMMNCSKNEKSETKKMMLEIVHLRMKEMNRVAFWMALSSCCLK